MQIIHIQQQHVPVILIAHAIEVTRRLSHGMSPERWTFSGVATGEEASFPSATYLRKRYKKLQRRIVSRMPSSSPPSNSRDAGTVEVSDSHSHPGGSDPSFQAIRALNGQPGARSNPDIIRAIIKDFDGNIVGTNLSAASTPEKEIHDTQGRLASSSHDPQSFSTRVDRLIKAIRRRRRIRYEPSEGGENINIFASNANGSETGSPRSVTDQIAALPNIFGRIISSRSENIPQSPDPSRSVDRFFCPKTCPGSQDATVQAPSSEATSPVLSDRGSTSVRVGLPIITENQRRELEERIRDKIAASVGKCLDASGETAVRRGNCSDDDGSGTTDDGYHQSKTVDAKKLCAISKSGKEECHTISPIRLDYQRGRGNATPSLGSSGSSSELSSPLHHKSKAFHSSVRHIVYPDNSSLLTSPVATTDAWISDDSDQGPSSEQKGGDLQLDREQKSEKVFSWLHRVKDALMESKESPTKKIGRAVNVFREGPVRTVGGSAGKGTPCSAMALKDVTNLRHPGYLQSNSFTEEKMRRDNFLAKSKSQKKQKLQVAPTQRATLHHVIVDPTHTTASSEESSGSTVKKARDEEYLHPEVEYSLARLEGRVPRRPSSPFPIRRSREDTSLYGSDVEVELPPSGLATPQPLRPDHESVVGNWTAPMEEAAEAGFECLLEPPEEV